MRPESQNLGRPLVGEKCFGCWVAGFTVPRVERGILAACKPKDIDEKLHGQNSRRDREEEPRNASWG